jgi:hypothetical protein
MKHRKALLAIIGIVGIEPLVGIFVKCVIINMEVLKQ